MNGISATTNVVPPATIDSLLDDAVDSHATMHIPIPSIARSNPEKDITSFCAYLWEYRPDICRDVFDDEIPRPQNGDLRTTKAEDDAYIERFFDKDTIAQNDHRFLKMVLIAISQYNHQQIVSCANEYFDKDKGNQELFQDPGTAQQMRATTDINAFFDRKFISDHQYPRFLTRVMQYIQWDFDYFKKKYALSPTIRSAADEITTTPTGSPGSNDFTRQIPGASDGRLSPISEVFPASLNVPRSRNSQTPIRVVQPGERDPAAEKDQDDDTPTNDNKDKTPSDQRHVSGEESVNNGVPQPTDQGNTPTAMLQSNSRRANASTERSNPESSTPTRPQQHTPSRELSARRIKEFVPGQAQGHGQGQGQTYGQGHRVADQRCGHMTAPLPTIADVVPDHPSLDSYGQGYFQPARNDQPRQNTRGRGGYGQGRGRGRGFGSFVVDPNSYQRMPAESVTFPQQRDRNHSTASERSVNWREKENELQAVDRRPSISDQASSYPHAQGFVPPHQQIPLPPHASGGTANVFANRTNNSAMMFRHASGQGQSPYQGHRPVSNGLYGDGLSDVTVFNIPYCAPEDIVRRIQEFVQGKCRIQHVAPDFIVLR